MIESPQAQVQSAIDRNPPVPNAHLVAWALVAEWKTMEGEKLLTRIASAGTPIWGFRGYMHEGLYGAWASPDLTDWTGNGQ